VPWCAACDRFLAQPTVRADGTCPTCGRAVDAGRLATATKAKAEDEEKLPPAPWHLKLLAVAVALYLGYRLFQGIEWVLG
jgi:hypothetical protein